MDYKELSIGFYVRPVTAIEDYITYIYSIDNPQSISLNGWGSLSAELLSPISLSERWMALLGFYSSSTDNSSVKSFSYLDISLFFLANSIIQVNYDNTKIAIRYVHELQQIVFDRYGYTKIINLADGISTSFRGKWEEGFREGQKIRVITPTSTYITTIKKETNSHDGFRTYDLL